MSGFKLMLYSRSAHRLTPVCAWARYLSGCQAVGGVSVEIVHQHKEVSLALLKHIAKVFWSRKEFSSECYQIGMSVFKKCLDHKTGAGSVVLEVVC